MIQLVVMLEINDPDAFHQYETQAQRLLRQHGGVLLSAFAPVEGTSACGDIDEIHYIQFPSSEAYEQYRSDPDLVALAGLRKKAIRRTIVHVSARFIHYADQDT